MTRLFTLARRYAAVYPLLVFVAMLVIYVRTLLPGTVGGDAGELQYAGPLLALVHPTGQPLYVLLGKVWSIVIPFGDAAYRMNLLAAVSVALGCTLLTWFQMRAGANPAPAMAAGLVLGLGATVWGQAVIADKYGFNVLLASLITGLALWWDKTYGQPGADRRLYMLALAFSVGLLHHRSLALFAPGLGLMVLYRLRADTWRDWRRALKCAGLAIIPALVVYPTVLPWLRSRQMTPLLWQPQGVKDWMDFLLERHVLSGEALVFDQGIGQQIEIYARAIITDYTIIGAVLALIGFFLLLKKQTGGGIFLAVSYGLLAFLSANFRGNERQFTYYLPSFVVLIYAAGHGLAALWDWASARLAAQGESRRLALAILGACLIGALPAAQFLKAYDARRLDAIYGEPLDIWRQTLKSGDMGARLTERMEYLPQNAVVAADWEQVTILWYMQQVEGVRPDLNILYPIERYADFADTERSVCLARHLPVDERWHPTNSGALICLGRDAVRALPDDITALDVALINAEGVDILELAGFRLNTTRISAGTHVPLSLVWRALTTPQADYSISIQLLDENWNRVWSRDVQSPVMGMYPTSHWTEGEVIEDYHEISIAREMPPGRYLWTVVVYRQLEDGSFENLRDAQENVNILGGTLEITGR